MVDRAHDPVGYAREVVGNDPFSQFIGIKVEEARDSYARVSLTLKREYCNAEARTHGGVIFTLADQALGVAANSRGYTAFAIEVKINYFQATGPGDVVTAEATPVDVRKRFSLWNIDVTNDKGEKVAVAHGLVYHMTE